MSRPGFGGDAYTSPETRTLTSIADGDRGTPKSVEELAQMLQQQGSQIRYLAANQKKLAKGVAEATQNPIQQIQQFISDIIVLLGGGQLAQGVLDFGDLQYILPALGALFGFGDGPFPLNLIAAAERFFFGYVVPTQAFTDLINHFIRTWLEAFGIDREFVENVQDLITAVGHLFDGVTGLLPNVNQLFTALGITAAGLGPLGLALKPILDLFATIDLKKFGDAVEFITDAINPHLVQLTKVINFLTALLTIFGSGNFDLVNSPLPELTQPFLNLQRFLGGINFAVANFNPITAAQQFLGRLLIPIGSLTAVQPNLQLDGGFDDDASIAEDSPAWSPEDLDPLIDYPEGWLWDLVGRTAEGSATCECDGADHALLGTVIPVDEGQTFNVGCWLSWGDVTATGTAFVLQVVTDTDDVTNIAAISNPGSDSSWVELAGGYTVPADVETIRIRLFIDGNATAGQVWWDDAAIRRTSVIQKGFVQGLVDDLAEIFGNFADFIDGILGTGHTFGAAVDFIASGLSTAATVADNIAYLLSELGFTTMSQLVSLLTTLTEGFNDAADFLGDLLSGAGEDTAAALGALIQTLSTMLNQISEIFNGTFSDTPLNTAVEQIQAWWEANTAYLQNIPNEAVQGLTGFGADIGASVQALGDSVWQGLRAFLGIPSGVGPPQVAGAAQQVRVDLNNATDIATLARAIQNTQAITKQTFLSIDPSADPVFPLANISGASPTTVSATRTKSLMGCVLLPDVSTKKSVTWLGGSLTNIDGVYVNLYKVDLATGAFDLFHASANIIGDLTSPGSGTEWQFYNLPMTDFFDVTLDGTGGTTSTVLAIGDYVVVEIVPVGSGTYNVVGFTNGIPLNDNFHPKALGASRVPSLKTVTFGAVGTVFRQQSTVATISGTVTSLAVTEGDAVLVAVDVMKTATAGFSSFTRTAIYDPGGANLAMTSLGVINYNNSNAGWVEIFGILNVPASGTKSISISVTGGSGSFLAGVAEAAAYSNVEAFGTPDFKTGVIGGGTFNDTFTNSVTGDLLFSVLAIQNTGGATSISSYNKTSRNNSTATNGSNNTTLLLGDAAGGASINITANATNGTWAVSATVPLKQQLADPPATISTPTYDAATPWIALAGAAGRAAHPPETVEFETAGEHTYNIPEWVIDGDYIDIVPIGAGAGGSFAGLINPSAAPTYGLNEAYKGGGAGQWNPIRLRYGDDYDIPTGTTTFTVNVGAGGAGGVCVHATHDPDHGEDGEDTTVVISGYPTITADGGEADATTAAPILGTLALAGDTPGNVVHEGVTYFGGTVQGTIRQPGNGPGGGGAAAYAGHHSSVNYDPDAGDGAPGACYITAVQG